MWVIIVMSFVSLDVRGLGMSGLGMSGLDVNGLCVETFGDFILSGHFTTVLYVYLDIECSKIQSSV